MRSFGRYRRVYFNSNSNPSVIIEEWESTALLPHQMNKISIKEIGNAIVADCVYDKKRSKIGKNKEIKRVKTAVMKYIRDRIIKLYSDIDIVEKIKIEGE